MISEYYKNDISSILNIINDAAAKYKGIIPDSCWRDPYMTEQELNIEFNSGVRMFGHNKKNKLVGVMGIQKINDVTLIRHAYTLKSYQRKGVGRSLLKYLLEINQTTSFLVGTWQDATWAIQFYEKFGFFLHSKNKTVQLLKKYWKIPSNQIVNSVVLEKQITNN